MKWPRVRQRPYMLYLPSRSASDEYSGLVSCSSFCSCIHQIAFSYMLEGPLLLIFLACWLLLQNAQQPWIIFSSHCYQLRSPKYFSFCWNLYHRGYKMCLISLILCPAYALSAGHTIAAFTSNADWLHKLEVTAKPCTLFRIHILLSLDRLQPVVDTPKCPAKYRNLIRYSPQTISYR